MKTKVIFGIFVAVAIIQLMIPAIMIIDSESTLEKGTLFRFKTAPVDPYDAFRGKYVALGFEENTFHVSDAAQFRRGKKAYAVIGKDREGFAKVVDLKALKPRYEEYVKVKVLSRGFGEKSGSSIRFEYPFNKYFLEEDKAPEAERLYRQRSRRGKQDAYLIVRLRNGNALIEELYVGGKPILEALKE